MTILTVVRDVCAAIGVNQPTSLFSGITTNRTAQELLSLANEMAQRIAYDTRDWTRLIKVQVYPGDGVTTAFALPADYRRLLLSTNVWRSTSNLTAAKFILNTDEWLQRRARNVYDTFGEWTLMGDSMLFVPIMPVGQTIHFAYLHKNPITLASGGVGDSFLADGDSFSIDERLLKLGMIWQWKAQKGSSYNEDLGTYGDALAYIMGHDSPAPIIIDRPPINDRWGGHANIRW